MDYRFTRLLYTLVILVVVPGIVDIGVRIHIGSSNDYMTVYQKGISYWPVHVSLGFSIIPPMTLMLASAFSSQSRETSWTSRLITFSTYGIVALHGPYILVVLAGNGPADIVITLLKISLTSTMVAMSSYTKQRSKFNAVKMAVIILGSLALGGCKIGFTTSSIIDGTYGDPSLSGFLVDLISASLSTLALIISIIISPKEFILVVDPSMSRQVAAMRAARHSTPFDDPVYDVPLSVHRPLPPPPHHM